MLRTTTSRVCGSDVSTSASSQVDTFPTLPRIVVFMTVRFVPVPEVLPLVRLIRDLFPCAERSVIVLRAWPLALVAGEGGCVTLKGSFCLLALQERYLVEQLGAPGFYHVIARYGYTQRVHQVQLHVGRGRSLWE